MSYKFNRVAKFELENLSVLLKSSVCLLIFGPCCCEAILEALLIKQHGPKINRQTEDFNNTLKIF